MSAETLDTTVGQILRNDTKAIGRAITRVLSGDDEVAQALVAALQPHGGKAHRVGLTGPPGVGKSTLVAALARAILESVHDSGRDRVAIVACDPSSPYSNGAFLGDRVRLAGFQLASEPRIFFRSLACRESGGVTQGAQRVANVLDAAGFPWIFLETVGVGQSEITVRDLVDTVAVLVSPQQGDEIQLTKAGILEIADILVVHRADQQGAEKVRSLLEERIESSKREADDWRPMVVTTEAFRGVGVAELLEAMKAHRVWLGGRKSVISDQ